MQTACYKKLELYDVHIRMIPPTMCLLHQSISCHPNVFSYGCVRLNHIQTDEIEWDRVKSNYIHPNNSGDAQVKYTDQMLSFYTALHRTCVCMYEMWAWPNAQARINETEIFATKRRLLLLRALKTISRWLNNFWKINTEIYSWSVMVFKIFGWCASLTKFHRLKELNEIEKKIASKIILQQKIDRLPLTFIFTILIVI